MGTKSDITKRVFDFTASFLGLLILWPILLIIALVIKIKMPDGPVLFKQKRVGKYGRLFTLVKFRTMRMKHNGSTVSVLGDERITSMGRFLRHYKLDELPELWNVLKGEMSLVGPRPDVPGYADLLEGKDRDILLLKPGITGPATLKYRNEEEILSKQEDPLKYNNEVIYPDKVKINLEYLHNHNIVKDFQIILKTIFGG